MGTTKKAPCYFEQIKAVASPTKRKSRKKTQQFHVTCLPSHKPSNSDEQEMVSISE